MTPPTSSPPRCRKCNRFLRRTDEALGLCETPCQASERARLATLKDWLAERLRRPTGPRP